MTRFPTSILPLVLVFIAPVTCRSADQGHFVGSASCRKCHQKEYDNWKQTRMANVVRDPRLHSEAVLGDFQHEDPNRPFDLSQVAFLQTNVDTLVAFIPFTTNIGTPISGVLSKRTTQ